MRVSKEAAARFLLFHQGLLAGSAGPLWRQIHYGEQGALQVIRLLECVQVDPVNVLERNQHLALAARVGEYLPEHLETLLGNSQLLDYIANARCIMPMSDWPFMKPITERLTTSLQGEVERLGEPLERVYQEVATNWPVSSRQLETSEKITGWWDNKGPKTKISSMALEVLWHLGRIGICKRESNERYYAPMEHVVPEAVQRERATMPLDVAEQGLIQKYMCAHRLFFPGHFRFGWMRMPANEKRLLLARLEKQGKIVPVSIDGVRRTYWALAADVAELSAAANWEAAPEATLLPPLDNLLWLRERLSDLFDFDYTWEIYIPREKRRYGNYSMPLLIGDRLCGRLDAHMDRSTATLYLDAFHPEKWVSETALRERNKLLASAPQAVQLLAKACQAENISVSAGAPEVTRLLVV